MDLKHTKKAGTQQATSYFIDPFRPGHFHKVNSIQHSIEDIVSPGFLLIGMYLFKYY